MKKLVCLVLLIVLGCNRDEDLPGPKPENVYEKNGITIYAIPEGIVIERKSFWTHQIDADTLIIEYTDEQIDGLLYWPPPYSIQFNRY